MIGSCPDTTGQFFTWLNADACSDWLKLIGSPSMEGTLLDQRVFEALVQRCLPMIKDHFSSVDVQLSVASLPYVYHAIASPSRTQEAKLIFAAGS